MSRTTQPSLLSLLPTLDAESLPPALIDLSSSLLALSRQKAATLKPEEEIARTYACAHIACDRLKASLNLPELQARPPCPPRAYKKLYSYLDSVLDVRRTPRSAKPKRAVEPEDVPEVRTPSKKPRPTNPSSVSKSGKALPQRPTPSKEASLAQFRTPTKQRRTELRHGGRTSEVPPWVIHSTRAICRQLEAPGAIPHVLAGVETVLSQPPPKAGDRNPADQKGKHAKPEKIPALIAAVYVLSHTRLMGNLTSSKEYAALRKLVIEKLRECRQDEEIQRKATAGVEDEKLAWEGYVEIRSKDVDEWLMKLSNQGWVELDWFTNIESGIGVDAPEAQDFDDEVGEGVGEDGFDEAAEEEDAAVMGLGTMMQERYDYLSAKKREAYALWKQGILEQIERARAQDEDAMEIS